MARALRIEYEGAFYHITSRGNERKKIFFSRADYDRFQTYLQEAADKFGYVLHCYVLMSNHYHLLIETPNANLSKLMHFINGSYTNYINRRRGRIGHLFQGRYKAIVVDRDSYLLELSRYVHLNPVRAGMTEKPEGYPYSSYRSFISKKSEGIVHRDLIWGMMSRNKRSAPQIYRSFVEGAMADNPESPLKGVYGGAILGRKSFIREVLQRLKEADLNRKDIAYRRELHDLPGVEEIMDKISRHMGLSAKDMKSRKGDQRNMTIYLLKRHTEMTNRQIGELFGELSVSAVAKVHERFSEKVEQNRPLKKHLSKISRKMSNVKG